jgi:ligand-binding SRPBCC domain-containing protein
MKIYKIRRIQFLPVSLEDAWNFFSSPVNLARITPAYMKFQIQYMSGGNEMYAGQIIRYKIYILPGIPVNWTTEITHVQQPSYFVDEQRFGPYALWHHQHHFRKVPGGIEMTDEVNYALPFGLLGRIVHALFVGHKVNAIFDHRFKTLSELFNEKKTSYRKSA